MGEIVDQKTMTNTYAGQASGGDWQDRFFIEGNVKELALSIIFGYTCAATAPVASAFFDNVDRIFAPINEFRLDTNGKIFWLNKGRDFRNIVSQFYDANEYAIDPAIYAASTAEVIYANFKLPVSKTKNNKWINFKISFNAGAFIAPTNNYTAMSYSMTFSPVYGDVNTELACTYSTFTVNGATDISLNRELGNLYSIVANGYNTTINLTLIYVAYDRIPLVNTTYYSYLSHQAEITHNAIQKTNMPNTVILKFPQTLDISINSANSYAFKLSTSTSQVFDVTQIYIDKVNPINIPAVPQYDPNSAHNTAYTVDSETVPKNTNTGIPPRKSIFGFKR